MAIGTQLIANVYPRWMKIRIDPSSNGQRFFSCFAEIFDSLEAERVLLSKMFKLFSEKLGVSNVYWVDLLDADFIQVNKWNNYTFPTVTGTLSDSSTVSITRVEDSSQFMNGVPTRIKYLGNEDIVPVLWTSTSPSTYGEIKTPCRIGLTVSGSEHYKQTQRDRGFAAFHMVEITGYDENGNYIEEAVYTPDDGTYKTKQIFSELVSIEWDGFDGTVTVFPEEMYVSYLTDYFHTGVSLERTGPLYIRGFTEPGGLVGVELFLKKFLNGTSYRNINASGVLEDEDIEEIVDSQIMLDESGTAYSVVDYTISPIDSRIWCLSSDGRVHVHTNTIQEFSIPSEAGDNTNSIDLVPDVRRIGYNEEAALWTFFRLLRGPLINLKIRRIDPDGVQTYLQADKTTWSASEYSFPGNSEEGLAPEDTHDTIRFFNTMDKLGEWHFYCDATLGVPGSQNVTETSRTAILCSSNTAEKSYSLGVTGVSKIYFSKENYLTVVTDLTSSSAVERYYRLYNDVYMPDINRQRLLLREEYEEVDITYV